MNLNRATLNDIIEISRRAGDAILEVYHREEGFETEVKKDASPVTEADLAAHHIIFPALSALDSSIPVLSEESEIPDYTVRSTWDRYWIIDPLDGTKEFIKKNGEFTVNIALIEKGVPILGVVYVPVLDIVYAGIAGDGAIKITADEETTIQCRSAENRGGDKLTVVASRSHGSEEVEQCVEKLEKVFGEVDRKSMGSSLKLCLVAEGAADIYPRLAPTSEWDTAAAQAVVEAAGGIVVDADLKILRYNTKADILNPYFYVLGDTEYPWSKLL